MASPVPPVAFVQTGHEIDYTPAAAVVAGDVAVVGGFVGVATHDIAASALGSVAIEGVFDFPKGTAVGSGKGAGKGLWYWDATALQATQVDIGNNPLGYSVADCADADTTVRIALDQYVPAQKAVNLLAASGAITPAKAGKYVITKAGVAAMTLAAPAVGDAAAGGDDFKEIEVTSDTANAHTLTCPAGVLKNGGAAVTIFTFTGTTSGGGIRLMAYNGTWKVLSSVGGAFS